MHTDICAGICAGSNHFLFHFNTATTLGTAAETTVMSEQDTRGRCCGSVCRRGGYGQVIVAAAFGLYLTHVFPFVGFGILYIRWSEVFLLPKATVGWVGAIFTFVAYTTGLFLGDCVERFGSRPVAALGVLVGCAGCALSSFVTNFYMLYATYGVITGVGCGSIMFANIIILQKYFDKRRPLAAGIATIGGPLGSVISAPLVRLLVDTYGWRGATLLMGGIVLQGLPLALLYRPHPQKKESDEKAVEIADDETKEEKKRCTFLDFSLMKRPDFLAFFICHTCAMWGFGVYYQNLPIRAVSIGVSFSTAAWVTPFIAVSSCLARLGTSIVANMECTNRTLMYLILSLLGAVVALTSGLVDSFAYMAANAAFYGAIMGSLTSLQPTVTVDLFTKENISRAQGLVGFGVSLSCLFATPLTGFIYDVTGDYDHSFYVVGAIQLLGCIIMIPVMIKILHQKQDPNKNVATETDNGGAEEYELAPLHSQIKVNDPQDSDQKV